MKSQYVVKVRSLAAPGPHDLTIRVQAETGWIDDSKNYMAPSVQPTIVSLNVVDDQDVSGSVYIEPKLQYQSSANLWGLYSVDGNDVFNTDKMPLAFTWDTSSVEPGPRELVSRLVSGDLLVGEKKVRLNVLAPPPPTRRGGVGHLDWK